MYSYSLGKRLSPFLLACATNAFSAVKRRPFTTTRLFATASAASEKIPIHLLAGFLGAGKTTTLKSLLENTEDTKVGVIVNDVAAVNIDAKLVNQRQGDQAVNGDIVQLQNGCACCSLADELLTSLETLLDSKDDTTGFDAILVELSGVADPVAIQNNWKQAVASNADITNRASLGNVVTVVDSCTFGQDLLAWDVAADRWKDDLDEDCTGNRKVAELLAEQVEAANLVLVNKQDLATVEELQVATQVVTSLNAKAQVLATSYGQVSAKQILALAAAGTAGTETAKEEEEESGACNDPDCTDSSHSHDHDAAACSDPDCTDSSHSHDHDHDAATCDDPECTDSSHSHSHDHNAATCSDPECTDSSHSHSHDHDAATCNDADCTDSSHSHSHDHTEACTDPECTDSSHSHSHDHTDACSDPDCTDTSHSHSHDHAATNVDNLGISNFCYTATRPFHATRLSQSLLHWPIPIKDILDFNLTKDGYDEKALESPFVGVLRSKGFCWIAPSAWDGLLQDIYRHDTVMIWSHAGRHLGVNQAGYWWDAVGDIAMQDFFKGNPSEYERVKEQDFVTKEFGDRRQELVFIGMDLREDEICKNLDACLLTDEEMKDYRGQLDRLKQLIEEKEQAEPVKS